MTFAQFAKYGRTRRDLARAEPFFAPFSFNFLDISRTCACHTLQTGPLPGITAGKICWKLVELSLTAGYPGTSQLLVMSVILAGFSSKQELFSNVFSGEIGP